MAAEGVSWIRAKKSNQSRKKSNHRRADGKAMAYTFIA